MFLHIKKYSGCNNNLLHMYTRFTWKKERNCIHKYANDEASTRSTR